MIFCLIFLCIRAKECMKLYWLKSSMEYAAKLYYHFQNWQNQSSLGNGFSWVQKNLNISLPKVTKTCVLSLPCQGGRLSDKEIRDQLSLSLSEEQQREVPGRAQWCWAVVTSFSMVQCQTHELGHSLGGLKIMDHQSMQFRETCSLFPEPVEGCCANLNEFMQQEQHYVQRVALQGLTFPYCEYVCKLPTGWRTLEGFSMQAA